MKSILEAIDGLISESDAKEFPLAPITYQALRGTLLSFRGCLNHDNLDYHGKRFVNSPVGKEILCTETEKALAEKEVAG